MSEIKVLEGLWRLWGGSFLHLPVLGAPGIPGL